LTTRHGREQIVPSLSNERWLKNSSAIFRRAQSRGDICVRDEEAASEPRKSRHHQIAAARLRRRDERSRASLVPCRFFGERLLPNKNVRNRFDRARARALFLFSKTSDADSNPESHRAENARRRAK